jgi:hypothetical protein
MSSVRATTVCLPTCSSTSSIAPKAHAATVSGFGTALLSSLEAELVLAEAELGAVDVEMVRKQGGKVSASTRAGGGTSC